MRALEITIFLIMVLTAPSVIQGMGFQTPWGTTTCTSLDCQARQTIYSMANSFQLQEIDLSSGNLAYSAWTVVTFSVTFLVYAFFWMLYLLSTIVLIGPALQTMFKVPTDLSQWLMIGVWILWLLAYVQWKRGGLGTDASR